MQYIVEELKMLRSEIIVNSRRSELLGMGDRFEQALLEHQSHQEADASERQQRRQAFLCDPDTKID